MGYNAYNSDDDNHLIEYLATYNSDGKARKGNALYKQLSENQENRWPWNKRHPWQSWRDHYVKNEKRMEKKIKAFQRGRRIAVEDDKKDVKQKMTKLDHKSARGDQASSSAHGKEQLNTRKRERESPSPQSYAKKRKNITDKPVGIDHCTLAGKYDGKNVVPETNIAQADQGRLNEEKQRPLPTCERQDTASNHSASSLNQRPQTIPQRDDDIEEDREVDQMLENVSESTTSGVSDHEHENLARQVDELSPQSPSPESPASQSDSSFNSLFDTDSEELVPDSEEEIGSARSNVNRREEDNFFRSSPETAPSETARSRFPTNKARMRMKKTRQPPILREGPFITTLTETTPISYNSKKFDLAGGSCSWPPARRKPHTPSSRNEAKNYQLAQFEASEVNSGLEKMQINHDANRRANLTRDDRKNQLPTEVSVSRERAIQPTLNEAFTQTTQISRCQSSEILPAAADALVAERRQIVHLTTSGTQINARPQSSVNSSAERYYGVSQSDKSVYNNDNRIDLRVERKKLFSRQSNTLNLSHSDSVLGNHSMIHSVQQSPSLSLQLSTQDQSLITSLGIQQAVTMMSKNHGFTEDVVSRILQNVNSIAKADEVLRLMRIKAEEEAAKQLLGDEQPDRMSASNHKHRRSSSIANKFQILELSDDQLPDYSPPRKRRVSTRLVERGRRAEAYTREARRGSGTVSPIKLVSNTSDTSNGENGANKARDNSRKSLPLEARASAEEDVFFERRGERVEDENTEDIQDLRDAHTTVSGALKRKEEGLKPQDCLRRFQQTAMLLKEIQANHQTEFL